VILFAFLTFVFNAKLQILVPMHLGDVIRKIRKERGLTLEALAFDIGIDVGNLSRLERGQRGYSPELLENLSATLGVRISELYQRAEEEGAQPVAVRKAQQQGLSEVDRLFQALNTENQALTMDFIRLMKRRQERGGGGSKFPKVP
jgi:transcriptional regulator with XRE-family HTH domain